KLNRDGAYEVIRIELEHQASSAECRCSAVDVQHGEASCVSSHRQEVCVPEHLVENQPVCEPYFEARTPIEAAAKIGVLVNRQEDILLLHHREALLISFPLFCFFQDDVCTVSRRLEQRLIDLHIGFFVRGVGRKLLCLLHIETSAGLCVPVFGYAIKVSQAVCEKITSPVHIC